MNKVARYIDGFDLYHAISERVMPIVRNNEDGSPRERLLRQIRLSLGGAALGVAFVGIATKIGGFGDYASIDAVGAVVGAMIAAYFVVTAKHR